MKARAHVIKGPGFIEDREMFIRLSGLGYELVETVMCPNEKFSFLEEVQSEDIVLFRSPWYIDSENFLFSRLLLPQFESAAASMGSEKKATCLFVGRSALTALWAGAAGEEAKACVHKGWQLADPEMKLGWVKLKGSKGQVFHAWFEGHMCPDLSPVEGMKPLLTFNDQTWVWAKGKCVFSFVDPLAFFGGSQLEEFGFSSMEDLNTNSDAVRFFLEELGVGSETAD